MSLYIVQADITTRQVDAIVCTANKDLTLGGIMGNKVKELAGPLLEKELMQFHKISVGESVITRGYNLKAKNVIHTVGPVFKDGLSGEPILLKKAYLSALQLATEYNLESIEFPLVSSGAYRYPHRMSIKVALDTINEYLLDHDLSVGICIYSKKTLKECEDLIKPYPFYKGEGFVDKVIKDDAFMREMRYFANDNNSMLISQNQFNDYVAQTKKNFTSKFMYFLNKSNKSNKDVYKKVHMDRKLFSKILKGESKTPKKNTIIALAFGMELDLHDTEELLYSAGYTLTNSILLDILVTHLLSQGSHDFDYLNKCLAGYGYAAL